MALVLLVAGSPAGASPEFLISAGDWALRVPGVDLQQAPTAWIVLYHPPAARAQDPPGAVARDIARRCRTETERVFQHTAAFVAQTDVSGAIRLLGDPRVSAVAPDVPVRGLLGGSVPQIRADRVQRRGITGAGVAVAVLDTGIMPAHPDLAGARISEACFCRTRCCPGGATSAEGSGTARSAADHGPHVAGIIASRGRLAPRGVAPKADLIAIRVLDDRRTGFLSDVAAALDWLAGPASSPEDLRRNLRVVNMSLGTVQETSGLFAAPCDGAGAEHALLADLVAVLRNRGVLAFAAAGNDGSDSAVASPACLSEVVAVGATNAQDQVASFSNRGPLVELFGPGENIVSDGAQGARVLSGTSMAAAHASATAALLFSALPGLPAPVAQDVLLNTGTEIAKDRSGRRMVRVDALRALRAVQELGPVLLGGGSRATDCLLSWEVVPAGGMQQRPRAVVRCRDGDPACDGDFVQGQCTFFIAPCFQLASSLLPRCDVSGVLDRFRLLTPSPRAPEGSVERENAEAIMRSLPVFPVGTSALCAETTPFRVPRPAGGRGMAAIRAVVQARDGRRDADTIRLLCE